MLVKISEKLEFQLYSNRRGEVGKFPSTKQSISQVSLARPIQHINSTRPITDNRMELTARGNRYCNNKRTRNSVRPGRRRDGRPCSHHSTGNERRTNYQARRRLSVLIGAIVFAVTVALRGGVLASSNPLELNGGSCLAMAGKGCVALAVDRRFGLEGQLVSTEAKRVLKVGGRRQADCLLTPQMNSSGETHGRFFVLLHEELNDRKQKPHISHTILSVL